MPVEDGDEIMLVTDGGQLIRCPVDGIRVAGRGTQGVIVFNTAEGEQVVAVERITEEDAGRGGDEEPRAGELRRGGRRVMAAQSVVVRRGHANLHMRMRADALQRYLAARQGKVRRPDADVAHDLACDPYLS